MREIIEMIEKEDAERPESLKFGYEAGPRFFRLDKAELALHTYLLGSTGCGKTTSILRMLERDLRYSHSVVVIDLRGDLIERVLGMCDAMKIDVSRIRLIDLRGSGGTRYGFNPLNGHGDPSVRALHVLDLLAHESSSWGVQLEDTLRSALLLLAMAREPLTKLSELFYDRSFRNACLGRITDGPVVAFWQRFDTLAPARQETLILPVLNKIAPLLAVPVLRDALSNEHAIDLYEVTNAPGSVLLVSLAVDELQRSGRLFGSLVVSAIAREIMARVNIPEPKRNPVRLYVDEFENMASETFESLIAEGRRFGLSLVLSHQTLAQLPTRLRSVIRNNVATQVIFRCGFEDAATLTRELGDEWEWPIRDIPVGCAYVLSRSGASTFIRCCPPDDQSVRGDPKRIRQNVAVERQPSAEIESGDVFELATGDLGEWL